MSKEEKVKDKNSNKVLYIILVILAIFLVFEVVNFNKSKERETITNKIEQIEEKADIKENNEDQKQEENNEKVEIKETKVSKFKDGDKVSRTEVFKTTDIKKKPIEIVVGNDKYDLDKIVLKTYKMGDDSKILVDSKKEIGSLKKGENLKIDIYADQELLPLVGIELPKVIENGKVIKTQTFDISISGKDGSTSITENNEE